MDKMIINSVNVNIDKTAYINWRVDDNDHLHNFRVVADGYFESVKCLTDLILNDNSDKKADVLIFPILFGLNQMIELYLKSIQWAVNRLMKNNDKFDGGHNLVELYGRTIYLIRKLEGGRPEVKGDRKIFNQMVSGLNAYINEIKTSIPQNDWKNMDYTRYPLMSDKESTHFYITDKKNITVDVEYLKERAEQIYTALSSLLSYYEGMLDYDL